MVNYRLFDDKGELQSIHFTETVIKTQTFNCDSRVDSANFFAGTINNIQQVPTNSSGTYANRLHIYCDQPGDYGVIINVPIGIYTGAAPNIYCTEIAEYGGFLIMYSNTNFAALDGVDITKASYGGSVARLPNVPAGTGVICVAHSFRTNKLMFTIPIEITANHVSSSINKILAYFTGVSNKQVTFIWTIEA